MGVVEELFYWNAACATVIELEILNGGGVIGNPILVENVRESSDSVAMFFCKDII